MNDELLRETGDVFLTCPSSHYHGTLPMVITYAPSNPLVVWIRVRDDSGQTYRWEVSRDLIREAVNRDDCDVTGIGDVTLKIRRSDRDVIIIRLPVRREDETRFAYLAFHRGELTRFVEETYERVPVEAEVDLMPLDEIDGVLEGWKK